MAPLTIVKQLVDHTLSQNFVIIESTVFDYIGCEMERQVRCCFTHKTLKGGRGLGILLQ